MSKDTPFDLEKREEKLAAEASGAATSFDFEAFIAEKLKRRRERSRHDTC